MELDSTQHQHRLGQVDGCGVEPAVVADGLHKQFGAVPALDGVTFEAARGTVLGLLGPNGGGWKLRKRD